MLDQLNKISSIIDRRTKLGMAGLFGLILIAAVLEMVGIGMFIPLLHVFSDPEKIAGIPVVGGLYHVWAGADPNRFIVVFSALLFGFFVAKNVFLGGVIYLQNGFVHRERARFARDLLRVYLARPYTFHLQRNTAELVRNVTLLSGRLFLKVIMPIVNTATDALTVAAVLVVLLLIDPGTTVAVVLLIGATIAVFYRVIRHRVREWGRRTVHHEGRILLWANQALGSIKETKLFGAAPFFVDAFATPNFAVARYQALSNTAGHLPRLFIEAVTMGGLLFLVVVLIGVQGRTVAEILPTLGVFGIAAMRLMPAFSKIVSNLTLLRENAAAIDIFHEELQNRAPEVQAGDEATRPSVAGSGFGFSRELRLERMSYRYPASEGLVLDQISLSIPCRKSVALVGRTGSGKTTLVDIILGLLEPTGGHVLVDGQDIFANLAAWQRRIGYIPQEIYLIDDTLRRNIAFGVADAEIDEEKLQTAIRTAQLEDVIDALPAGPETVIGEHGTRLSGGQRQRVGIARALYNDPEVLVMDEATSALDSETESHINRAIDGLSGAKTLIIIAHRLSTVRHCHRIVLLDRGRVVDTGTFDELAERNGDFSRMIELAQVGATAAQAALPE